MLMLYLLTPYRQSTSTPQSNYNYAHLRTIIIIEKMVETDISLSSWGSQDEFRLVNSIHGNNRDIKEEKKWNNLQRFR